VNTLNVQLESIIRHRCIEQAGKATTIQIENRHIEQNQRTHRVHRDPQGPKPGPVTEARVPQEKQELKEVNFNY